MQVQAASKPGNTRLNAHHISPFHREAEDKRMQARQGTDSEDQLS